MVGNAIAVTPKPTAAIATQARLKLRSRNSSRDSSGSSFVRACDTMKTTSTAMPATISDHTEIGPSIVPQSYVWPSWMPKTSRNIPTAESTTPGRSNRRTVVGSSGTSRTASTRPTTPTGTLTKKIHSQPSPSTSTPPRIGPTSVATPATAPQRLMARPRDSAGNVRVITAMVCGIITDAPRPCTTRAAMSAADRAREATPQRGEREYRQADEIDAARARNDHRGGR